MRRRRRGVIGPLGNLRTRYAVALQAHNEPRQHPNDGSEGMHDYSAVGYHWDPNGPTFLWSFVTVSAAVLAAVLAYRRRLLAGPRAVGIEALDAPQVAYLNWGDRLAVFSVLCALRAGGSVVVSEEGELTAVGRMHVGATALDQAVYNAAERRVPPSALHGDVRVVAALARLREDLARRGLAVAPERRHAARLAALALIALLAGGAARVMTGLASNRPVGILVLILLVLAVVTLVLLGYVPRRTRAARRALRELSRHYDYLAPKRYPAWATYGPTTAAMGVALFGPDALWAWDPHFAADAAVPRNNGSLGGGGSSGGGDDGCGGGISCGGCGGCGGGSGG